MEYNESATPPAPEGNPVQDNVSAGKVGADESGTETTRIETTGTESTRTGTPGGEWVGVGTSSAPGVSAPGVSAPGVSAPEVSAPEVKAPVRPGGPNASAIVVGLLAMLFAGLIIARETLNWRVDWSRLGPGAIVGIGVVMVLIGAIGLIRRHDHA